jgi:Tfp pilus assembly protein PilW
VSGFSLIEVIVAMGIMLLVMGGTLAALNSAFRSTETARGVTGMNNNLRVGIDLLVRDLIQVGQGLPTGRTIQVPNGTGAQQINRPAPAGSACSTWPAGTLTLPAVTVGPGCGLQVNGVATDTITTLAVDSALEGLPIQAFDVGAHTATVSTAAQFTGGRDISAGGPDDVRVGDLMMFTKGTASALVYVTAVDGAQSFTFASGDPMGLNQFDAALNGTVDDLAALAPTTANSARVSRIRMMTYYVDTAQDPTQPRLVRHVNWGDPAVPLVQRGRTVAFAIENLQFSYDLVDGVTNPSNVRMTAADLAGTGACAPAACTQNQIRKVNVFLAGRSDRRFSITRDFFRNSVSSQVSLRSLALVDRYR